MIEILADANATLLAEGNATQAVEQAKGVTGVYKLDSDAWVLRSPLAW